MFQGARQECRAPFAQHSVSLTRSQKPSRALLAGRQAIFHHLGHTTERDDFRSPRPQRLPPGLCSGRGSRYQKTDPPLCSCALR